MFRSPKVEVFMQNAELAGDADDMSVRLTFYITPIRHLLAAEISPDMAKQLFHPDASGDMKPVLVMPNCKFDIGTIPLQQMELYPSDLAEMDDKGVILKPAQISNLAARKLFPDDPNYTLEFRVEVPKDQLSVEMMSKYFKKKLYISFDQLQKELPKGDCSWCDDNAIASGEDKFACQKHLKKLKGQVNNVVFPCGVVVRKGKVYMIKAEESV